MHIVGFHLSNRVFFLKMLWKGQSFYKIQIRKKERKNRRNGKMIMIRQAIKEKDKWHII